MTAPAGNESPEPDAMDRTFWTDIFAGLSNPGSVSVGDTDRTLTPDSSSECTWIDRLFAGCQVDEIPLPPPSSPILVDLIDDHGSIPRWSGGGATLTVADIIEETHDVKTFRLIGEAPVLFSYRPGQFVTLLLDLDGEAVQRSYSISSSPSRPHVLEITVKRVPGGRVSNWLCDHLRRGQSLTLKGPAGRFTCFDHPASKMLFIAAGSGISPLMSMIRWIADTTADVDVTVLASFKSPADIIFRKELELISARHPRFRIALTLTSAWAGRTESWTGLTGRIGKSRIAEMASDLLQRHVFLCGPEPFAAAARKSLHELGFDQSKLFSESFGSGRTADGGKKAAEPLSLSGRRHLVQFSKSGKTVETDECSTILELAEANGIELDYACRLGSCGECEIRFTGLLCEKPEFQLVGREKKAGLALACCSVALSDLVVAA